VSEDFHPPIRFDRVLDDPGLVRRLVEANGPYYPVQRYIANAAEYRALSGSGAARMIVAPNFRGDWAYDRPLIAGVEPLFGHAGFREAAARLFDAEIVEPFSVYANITWQLPFDQGAGHTDVPEFRGVNRTRYPTPLLTVMGHSRLFEAERIPIATAVAWFYDGDDGGFTYWPDGPDAPPAIHEGGIFNTALEADNERMFHRVRPVGDRRRGLPSGLTLDTRLERREGDRWAVVEGDETIGEPTWPELRVSISWKARVFADGEALRAYREHTDDLTIDEVFRRFEADLARRGVAWPRSDDPVSDPAVMEVLGAAYVRAPTVFEPAAA
jgi:hypothetical protein